jgi:hypothetical protein
VSIKNELLSLEARQTELQRHLEAPETPQLLHPRMADVYQEKVTSLCKFFPGGEPSRKNAPAS